MNRFVAGTIITLSLSCLISKVTFANVSQTLLLTKAPASSVSSALIGSATSVSSLPEVSHPKLVINQQDIIAMRNAIHQAGTFQTAYLANVADIKLKLQSANTLSVPVPKDGGGGLSHEQHKRNYQFMYDAAVLYQLSEQPQYAQAVTTMLKQYAVMYPTLPLHPKQKPKTPGKLFWQSLNEAVWLLYSIQAYDLIYDALSVKDRQLIETQLFRPMVDFLSTQAPHEFNKIHNHGTWSTAAVGMAGYVLNEPKWVEQALKGLDLSGDGGFLRQLDELFSPEGYYSEGPYYQRYAILPFVTFAKAIEQHEPQRKIFEYRNGVLVKAVEVSLGLTYQGRFIPFNDAIKQKDFTTTELVQSVAIVYGINRNPQLLDIAQQQQRPLLTGDGLLLQQDIAKGLAQPFSYHHLSLGDGADGKKGGVVVMRNPLNVAKPAVPEQALIFKATTQGQGHGHFDRLHWQFYDAGKEIVSDYGAARFVNVEAKDGGGYLAVNQSWAKQTVAHNTVVVDQTSHFAGNRSDAELYHPQMQFFAANDQVAIAKATETHAYDDVALTRTIALISMGQSSGFSDDRSVVIDLVDITSPNRHQYDLPVHYQGQFIDTNVKPEVFTSSLSNLGENHGYQHLWLTAKADVNAENIPLSRVTWLSDNGHFYSHFSITPPHQTYLFTRLGANDPQMDLRPESGFIQRVENAQNHTFVNVLIRHGFYNPVDETTQGAEANLLSVQQGNHGDVRWVKLEYGNGYKQLLAFNQLPELAVESISSFVVDDQKYTFTGRVSLIELTKISLETSNNE